MKSIWLAIILIILAISLWIGWAGLPFILEWLGAPIEAERLGQWGDSFGALNTLFGAFGFTAVFLTLIMQGRTLRHQQEDQHRQRFDLTFFELLRLMRELQEKITFRHSATYRRAYAKDSPNSTFSLAAEKSGHAALESALRELRYWIDDNPAKALNLTKAQLSEIYIDKFHKRSETTLGPYFRIIYTILNRLSEDTILTNKEKSRYGNLLRSQLTSFEITIAAFNGLAPVSKDFGKLIKEFRLLKYMPDGTLRKMFIIHYTNSAFAPRD